MGDISYAMRKGHTEVIDADLSKYFDTIPHAKLTDLTRRNLTPIPLPVIVGRLNQSLRGWAWQVSELSTV